MKHSKHLSVQRPEFTQWEALAAILPLYAPVNLESKTEVKQCYKLRLFFID
jgi:hypothetical protein